MASNVENVSIWWRHHGSMEKSVCPLLCGNDTKLLVFTYLNYFYITSLNNLLLLEIQKFMCYLHISSLSHWGRVMHICVGNLTIIGPDNGLSPGWRQAIIWTNSVILLIGPWGTNFSEILIGVQAFLFKKMHLKMLSAKWCPFCLGPNVLMSSLRTTL